MFNTADIPAPSFSLLGTLRRNRLLLSLISLHVAFALAVSLYVGRSYWGTAASELMGMASKLLLFMFANFIIWRLGVAMFSVRPKRPIQWMLHDLRSKLLDPEKAPDALISFLCMVALIVTYTFLKNEIHALNPSLWDVEFAQWDRFLHGGTDPWLLLQPVLGNPYVTTAVNVAYHLWFALMYVAVCVACLDRSDPTRSTVFLVAFVLCWFIGGNLLATVFASVGPVYFEAFGLGDTFATQIELLKHSDTISPVWALNVHDLLIQGYLDGGLARGISAMPSMHVASSVLLTLYAFSYARWAGWIMVAFTGIIMLGSVHLAWHYAIDGYVSVFLMLFLWWLAQKLTLRFGPNS